MVKYTTTVNIALFPSRRQYFKTFYKKAIIHTEKRTSWQNFMQNNPRTEWMAPPLHCNETRRCGLSTWGLCGLPSVTLLAALQRPACLHEGCFKTQLRLQINSPNSWSLPNEKKKKRWGHSLCRSTFLDPQAELLQRDCTSSGSRNGHLQTSVGENTGTVPWSRARENGMNTSSSEIPRI